MEIVRAGEEEERVCEGCLGEMEKKEVRKEEGGVKGVGWTNEEVFGEGEKGPGIVTRPYATRK